MPLVLIVPGVNQLALWLPHSVCTRGYLAQHSAYLVRPPPSHPSPVLDAAADPPADPSPRKDAGRQEKEKLAESVQFLKR